MAQVIKLGRGSQAGAAAVLKLTDFMAEARAAVLEARKEAARIVAEAHTKAEQAEREAANRGYEEGFARGMNDGYADGERSGSQEGLASSASQACQALGCAAQIAEELAAARDELLCQARSEMLEFALAVAAKIVRRVAATDLSAAQENLAKALAMAGYAGQIIVKVNPDQLSALQEHCREMVESLTIKGKVKLVADNRISPGGVTVLTEKGQIDATIETQLARVAKVLVDQPAEDCQRRDWHDLDGSQTAAAGGQFIPADRREAPSVTPHESV